MRSRAARLAPLAALAVGALWLGRRAWQANRPPRAPADLLAAPERLAQRGPLPRVVVVGLGFGGLTAALDLARLARRRDLEVVVVDRRNYHLFAPLLYQVAANIVEARHTLGPARALAYQAGFVFRQAEVTRVDLERAQLETSVGPIPYDYLILAPGSVTNYYGLASAEQHALALKSPLEAERIRDRVLALLEQADDEPDPARRRELLTLAIVGGGSTGAELAGALAALARDVAGRQYPRLRPEEVRILVFEATATILPGFPEALQRAAMAALRQRGVELVLNAPVQEVGEGRVTTGDGRSYAVGLVVWAAGVRASPLIASLPGERLRDGRLLVDPYLRLPGHPNVYIVGDAAAVRPEGESRPLPAIAPFAIQSGHAAAENVARALAGLPPRPFRYRHRGDLVITGRYAAVANVFGLQFDGLAAWLLWRVIHLAWLTGLRARLSVLVEWALLSFTPRQTSRLEP